jgi:GNAT superfamily N-acetyltransferase
VGRLETWLSGYLGRWPPRRAVDVVASPRRVEAGWDGRVRAVVGVEAPDLGVVLSVPPDLVDAVRRLGDDWRDPAYTAGLNALVVPPERPPHVLDASAVFRWTERPAQLPDLGEWVAPTDPRVPEWLRPFNGGVLVAWADDGGYLAGVGIKRHDEAGEEIAVGTEPAARGRGLARRLVATAARATLGRGAISLYLHEGDNLASAHVADAAGFPDLGWHSVGFWPVAEAFG